MNFILQIRSFFQKHWVFVLYVISGCFLRFWNYRNSLYFIYDQGRDAFVFQRIAQGDPVLVGPTSGLSGFFLGPLWYYIGLPGYLLFGGDPYGICLWFIGIACLALPLFYYLSHQLFPRQKFWAVLCAVILAVIPGSITASLMIWNPLLSVPLMLVAVLALWKARESRFWLAVGFLALALTLQSEFAYAVFYMVVMVPLIPWIRRKFDLRDFLLVGAVVGVTILPQIGFELRHQFLMTKSLLASLQDTSKTVSWKQQWENRPDQLIASTNEILYGRSTRAPFLFVLSVAMMVLAGLSVTARKFFKPLDKLTPEQTYLWRLVTLFAVLPYPFFLIWRGNYGNFFWYYLTCQFVFLIPLLVKGLQLVVEFARQRKQLVFAYIFIGYILMSIAAMSADYWYGIVFKSDNNAGLAKITSAAEKLDEWAMIDGNTTPTIRTFTANIMTEQYDYVLQWHAKNSKKPVPLTQRTGNEQRWYILIESRPSPNDYFFQPWYYEATKGGKLVRSEKIGVLTLETWERE